MKIENFKTITLKTLLEFTESELSTLDNLLSNNEILKTKMEFDNDYNFIKSSEDRINKILDNVEELEYYNREDYNTVLTESDFKFKSNLIQRLLIGFYKYDCNMDLSLAVLYLLEFLQNLKDNYYNESNDLEISEKTKLLFIAHAINRIKELNKVRGVIKLMLKTINVRSEDISRESASLENECLENCEQYILITADLEYGILTHKHVSFKKGFDEINRIKQESNSDYLTLIYENGSIHEFVNNEDSEGFIFMGESLE